MIFSPETLQYDSQQPLTPLLHICGTLNFATLHSKISNFFLSVGVMGTVKHTSSLSITQQPPHKLWGLLETPSCSSARQQLYQVNTNCTTLLQL
jgi:hypothetical protein